MNRKLFPISTTNETMPCPDVCGPTCQYDCYPYSDTYALPSSPPPPPSTAPVSTKHGENISPYVIVIATLLGVAFLIISYYLVIVKNCAGLDWFRPRRRQEESTEEDFLDENTGPAIDHPIWYIRTVGLQPSTINSIAVFKYKKGDSLIEGTDCSICLSEFQDDEILRLLPKCDHAFHIPCIDTWLRSHTNCPVCRAGVISSSMTAPAPPNLLNYNDPRSIGFNQDQYTETTNDAGLSNSIEIEVNRIRTEEEDEFSLVDLDVQGETLSIGVEFDETASGNNIAHDEMQKMRRSISADALMVAKIKQAMVNIPMIAESEEKTVNTHKSEPSENSLPKSKLPVSYDGANSSSNTDSVLMKRSLSCGGRSFFSRHSRSLSSVLPL